MNDTRCSSFGVYDAIDESGGIVFPDLVPVLDLLMNPKSSGVEHEDIESEVRQFTGHQ